MFGSKHPKEEFKPYKLIILTQNYVIEGTNKEEDNDLESSFSDSAWENEQFNLILSDADVKPIGPSLIQPQTYSKWVPGGVQSIVAILPGDDAALGILKKAFEDRDHHFKVMILADPYLIVGTALSDEEELPSVVSDTYRFIPVINATVSMTTPENKFGEMNIPMLALNAEKVQSIGH